MIQCLIADNLLSFDHLEIPLRSLNVLIGPNGSGKSNLIEILSLLRAAPGDISQGIRQSGSILDWLWKGIEPHASGRIEVLTTPPSGDNRLHYALELRQQQGNYVLKSESLKTEHPFPRHTSPYVYFDVIDGEGMLNVIEEPATETAEEAFPAARRELRYTSVTPGQTVLSQRRDPVMYPELTYLARGFQMIHFFRSWNFGRHSPARLAQPADLPSSYLAEDGSNLGLVVNALQLTRARHVISTEFERFFDRFEGFAPDIRAGQVQLNMHEKGLSGPIPATRMSDGMLRYLCLLTILCHPEPPPLVCIEEPELGLHPDIIPRLGELLKQAAERTQLIITTHSDVLVDALSDTPEAVIVCERTPDGPTKMTRLSHDDLKVWLEHYSLGELWRKGEIGGTP